MRERQRQKRQKCFLHRKTPRWKKKPQKKKSQLQISRLIHDSWQGPNRKGEIYHFNKTGRKCKVDPRKEERPVPASQLDGRRITVKTIGKSVREEDDWKREGEKFDEV